MPRPTIDFIPVMVTGSPDEVRKIRAALMEEILPRGTVLRIYVNDLAYIIVEINQLRRYRVATINAALPQALENILLELLRHAGEWGFQIEEDAVHLAQKYFCDEAVKAQVLRLLRHLNLDASAIEAEAMRISAGLLEMLDRKLTSAEHRRDRTFRAMADYRAEFAHDVQDNA